MSSNLPSQKKISTAKAAQFLGVSRWTLRRWGDKKLISFTTSRTGYRYYQQEDLEQLLEKHAIVHTALKKKKVNTEPRDETLLLPAPPKPVEQPVESVLTREEPVAAVAAPVAAQVVPESPVEPPPSPPKPPKKSILSGLWKILPFTGAAVFLAFVLFPTKPLIHTEGESRTILGFSVEKPSLILPLLSFRDVVLAAATDSSDLSGSSVEFFLSGSTESVDSMLTSNGKTPEQGNTIYLSSMNNFASFQESPFAYLNGSHGAAGPVAIIDNAQTLRNHPFFANVHDGDKLLIYKESGKAILFRPLTNEVIAFAPLDAVPSTSYQQLDGQPVVALRNGMGTPYDMKPFEAELTYVAPDSVVVDNENASKSDYKKSIIVDVVGNKKAQAQELANKLRLSLEELPVGEYRPPAGVDFLIILDKDRVLLMNYLSPSASASAAQKQP